MDLEKSFSHGWELKLGNQEDDDLRYGFKSVLRKVFMFYLWRLEMVSISVVVSEVVFLPWWIPVRIDVLPFSNSRK